MMKKLSQLTMLLIASIGFTAQQSMAQTSCNCTVSFQRTNIKCFEECTGALTATAAGGSGPYSYVWSNGQTGATINNLCAGYYAVTVSDANGCVITDSIEVTQRGKIMTTRHITHVSCYGACDGTDSVEIHGGTAPYTVLWNTGATTRKITGLCPGTYNVIVTDANGCVRTCNCSRPISEPPPVVVINTESNVSCTGLCDGSIVAAAQGGTAPYDYLWSNNSTSDVISGLCGGIYTVTATDANGCTGSAQSNIVDPSPVDVNIDIVVSSAPGCLTAVPSGGNAPYTYLWSNNATTAGICDLAAGCYTVTVTDANGCSDEGTDCITTPCGGFRTQTQGGWGAPPNGNNPASLLHANFNTVFPNGITIGCNNTLKLTSAVAVQDFLPSGSTPKALPAGSLVNPGGAYKNVLAGQVMALAISLGMDAQLASFGASGTLLADQVINSGSFNGWTVQQAFDEANKKLGGCVSAYSYSALNDLISNINENYVDGNVDNGFLSCPGAARLHSSQAEGSMIAIFPNPATESVTISLMTADNIPADLYIYNISGQLVKHINASELSENKIMLNTADMINGIYNVVMVAGAKTFSHKLIVQ